MIFYNLCKNTYFLFNLLFIICSEYFLYWVYGNYSERIDRLIIRLAEINILCVKMFQAFALDNNFIDDDINNKLIKYTDNVPWTYGDISYIDLINVTNKYDLNFNSTNNKPINSGMISLVFKFPKISNPKENVIIKMKRKNIEKKLDDAIEKMLFSLDFLSYLPILSKFNLSEVVNKNIDFIRHQTNFLEEVDNMERMRKNCKNLKYIQIPIPNRTVTEEFSNIIMMDFIDGLVLNKVEVEDYETFAKLAVKFSLVTFLIHGYTHGDLHSGNMLFIKDHADEKNKYKLGILDFGIMYELDSKCRIQCVELMSELFTLEKDVILDKLLTIFLDPPGILKDISEIHYNNIKDITEKTIKLVLSDTKHFNQVELYNYVYDMNEYIRKNKLYSLGICLSDNIIKMQMVLGMVHGIAIKICGSNIVNIIEKCVKEMFHIDLFMDEMK